MNYGFGEMPEIEGFSKEEVSKILKKVVARLKSEKIEDAGEIQKIIQKEVIEKLGLSASTSVVSVDMKTVEKYEKITGANLPRNNASDIVGYFQNLDFVGSVYYSLCVIYDRIKLPENTESGFYGGDLSRITGFVKDVDSLLASSRPKIFGMSLPEEVAIENMSLFPTTSSEGILFLANENLKIMELAIEKAQEDKLSQKEAKDFIERACRNFLANKLEAGKRASVIGKAVCFVLDNACVEEEVDEITEKIKGVIALASKATTTEIDETIEHTKKLTSLFPEKEKKSLLAGILFGYACLLYNRGETREGYESLLKEVTKVASRL